MEITFQKKEEINPSTNLKEDSHTNIITPLNRLKPLRRKHKNPLKHYRKTTKRDVMEQNYPRSKTGSKNNKENPKGDNSGDRKPRKEIRK